MTSASLQQTPARAPKPRLADIPSPRLDGPAEESSSASDSNGDEEPVAFDQDDAQSIFQPSISAAATRLTSPKTPAAEKAAALEAAGGLFSVMEDITAQEELKTPPPPAPSASANRTPAAGPSAQQPSKLQTRRNRVFSLGQLPSTSSSLQSRLPSPWSSGPKELIVQDEPSSRNALSGVFGPTRHRRTSSAGAETLKKIREALPSISLPSFFSSSSSIKSPVSSDMRESSHSVDGASESKQRLPQRTSPQVPIGQNETIPRTLQRRQTDVSSIHSRRGIEPTASPRASSTLSVRPRTIRRTTSDESMLYNSLSRASSFGDDNRWNDLRDMKNVRFKAITDSWDMPTFRMPHLQSMLPESLKKHPMLEDLMLPATIPEASTLSKDEHMSELDRALQSLTGDLVILGGYRGSVLRSTKTHRQVWVPVKVGLNIRQVDLEVGLNPEDEERMEETIHPDGMLKNIGPVDISKRLFKRVRECENVKNGKLRVWDYGYDWRLSPALLSKKLIAFMEGLPSNNGSKRKDGPGALVIAHSLGGLITRHAVNQRPELFSGVVYAGTPQRCVNILGPFRNGDAVLFNEKVLTAQVNFSLRTSFVFLPEDGFCFINKDTGEEYRVDFHDAQQWVKYAWSPCVGQPLPPTTQNRSSTFGSLRELSGKIPHQLRNRGNSAAAGDPPRSVMTTSSKQNGVMDSARNEEVAHDRTLAMQMGTLPHSPDRPSPNDHPHSDASRARSLEYLTRTLAETKQFRAETAHRPEHAERNAYPPLAVMYGKDTPTVYAAHVSSREVIGSTDAYENLVFQSGDGVVLAREAMLPAGYETVKDGRISTDRGHITMLGDLEAVGRALQAVVRGRQKGIGLGHQRRTVAAATTSSAAALVRNSSLAKMASLSGGSSNGVPKVAAT